MKQLAADAKQSQAARERQAAEALPGASGKRQREFLAWRERDARRIDADAAKLEETVSRYLRTHPLNADRMAAMHEQMSGALEQMACTQCEDYMRSLNRSLASRKMVPNEFPENQAGGYSRRCTRPTLNRGTESRIVCKFV